ncbi:MULTISPECIES: hypothetical protein [unclassified Bradyrhizobium]|uniref:hypothetical protein n=1 Tax=unclassified Bradyrhizobium TaxID=2631580 RepID=UPI001BAAE111|nr:MULTISPECIES: hypothetical protein [unclassified Bradyrhizobium]MBR1206612.1 hypothetical protein [Bradyrhizobium sp. AUGA SZCCT0124]MBR1315410.1 hypothetical protein [Bradyrhizobium sp. AUGA SZCCT0051]MBR1338528.1 hypothetical protein [Bradyrhizobium sp. AUGA SZCCT0105]MBR1356183.1 hypothetical protein [Bradyrhizobium sp. AUGA SZCCT0045]
MSATNTPSTTARQLQEQQVHYLRFAVNYNDPGIAAGVKKQTLPKGALLIGTDVYIGAAFNAATTNVLTVGSAAGSNADIVSAAAENEGATGLTQNIPPTGAMLGPLAADTPVFVQYTQTGAAATAGSAVVIVKYIPNNDM